MRVAIGLGSSLGDRRRALELALRRLDRQDLRLVRASRLVVSPPLAGGTARNWFLNAVAVYDTELAPEVVLARCRALEELAGRRRARHWGDRTLDVDVLLYGELIRDDALLTLPHPAIARRPFVHGPLVEVWPDAVDPRSGRLFRDIACDALPRPWAIGLPAAPRRRP